MVKLKHELATKAVKLLNVIMMTIPFAICWYCYYASRTETQFYRIGNWVMVALFAALYGMFGKVYESFLISYTQVPDMIYSQTIALCISDGFMYVIIMLLSRALPNVLPGLAALAGQVLLSTIWCAAAHRWYFTVFPKQRAMVIYDVRKGMEELIESYGLASKYDVVSTHQVKTCLNDLSLLDGLDCVFLSGVHSRDRNRIIKYCVEKDISALIVPRVGDVIMSGARKIHLFHLPMLRVTRYNPSMEYLFVKRVFDIVSSSLVLIILSPIMLITAIAIKATDGGPVFYRQCRLTRDGKRFNVLKFRSMRVDAEKDGVARLSTGENDDRITPVGRIIRKVRVDELPQLLNILGGSMSVVGPRPERPEIAAQYEAEMPEFSLRLQAKAGLTGYAQVYGKYNTTPYDKLQMDLMYIAHPSLVEDLKIIFATIKILFMPESTEGIAAGQTTAFSTDDGDDEDGGDEDRTA